MKNGLLGIFEGSNMSSTDDAVKMFMENKVVYGPAKAANAGGVAVSGLEMAQNSQMLHWSREMVDEKLKDIMENIHSKC